MTVIRNSIRIGLYIYGDALDPARLTSEFGVEPTEQHKLGQTHVTTTGATIVKKTGMWALLSNENVDDFARNFDELVDRFKKIADRGILDKAEFGVESAFIDIFVCAVVDENGGSAEFEFSRNQLAVIQQLGVPIKFTTSTIQD